MPRKSRRQQSEEPTHVADSLDALAEKHGLKPASQAPKQLDPPEAEPPAFAERVRGPRPRKPGEAASVFTSASGGFGLTENGQERAFEFNDAMPPGQGEKPAMNEAGLQYRPHGKKGAVPRTPEGREATDRPALKFSGKDVGRGR